MNKGFKTATDISGHFPTACCFKLKMELHIPKSQILYKLVINGNLIKAFKSIVLEISWEILKSI